MTVPCMASRWADEYSDQYDRGCARVDALLDDPDALEDAALDYLEAKFPELEFDTDEQWQQWIADNYDRIVEWAL